MPKEQPPIKKTTLELLKAIRDIAGRKEPEKPNWEKFECLKTLEGHTGYVLSVIESADQKHLISSSDDKTIRIWDKQTGHCLKTLEGHTGSVRSVIESADQKHLISSSDDKTIRIWGEKEPKV